MPIDSPYLIALHYTPLFMVQMSRIHVRGAISVKLLCIPLTQYMHEQVGVPQHQVASFLSTPVIMHGGLLCITFCLSVRPSVRL